jgi:hypothetical protein
LIAVHARHADVADDKVGEARVDCDERLGTAPRGRHLVALLAQCDGDGAQQLRLVVHDQ